MLRSFALPLRLFEKDGPPFKTKHAFLGQEFIGLFWGHGWAFPLPLFGEEDHFFCISGDREYGRSSVLCNTNFHLGFLVLVL
jgi:hypothetical protein